MEDVKVDSGFREFFEWKLKKTGHYHNDDEVQAEAGAAVENMQYDMKNGDSLVRAFNNACRDLHITQDAIESYI